MHFLFIQYLILSAIALPIRIKPAETGTVSRLYGRPPIIFQIIEFRKIKQIPQIKINFYSSRIVTLHTKI